MNSSSKLPSETRRTFDLPHYKVPAMQSTTINLEQNSGPEVKTYFFLHSSEECTSPYNFPEVKKSILVKAKLLKRFFLYVSRNSRTYL